MIDFGKYRYIGSTKEGDENKDNYAYDQQHFDELVNTNRYSDAVEYLSNFQFNDATQQKEYLKNIDKLKRNGEIIEALYRRIDSPTERATVKFADKVGKPGWYQALRYEKDAAGADLYANDDEFKAANPEAAEIAYCLESMGGKDASKLSITFNPKKYGGFVAADWLVKDQDDLDEFYRNGNFNQRSLENSGVSITKNDNTGETTFVFDKTNPMALSILAALPFRSSYMNRPVIDAYRVLDDGTVEKVPDREYHRYYPTYNENVDYGDTDSGIGNGWNDAHALRIKDIIKTASSQRDKIFKKRNLAAREVSSTVFDLTTDRTDQLETMLSLGQISETEFNRRMKEAKDLVGWVRAQTYVPGIYSNIKNDEYSDEHFEQIGQEEWSTIKAMLGHFDNKDVIIQGQTINGELGLRITLPQAQRRKRLAKMSENDFLTHTDRRNVQFFIPASAIPGILGDLQAEVDNDTNLQAIQDYTDMADYGVIKTLYNGEKIYIDDLGNIVRERDGQKFYDDSPDRKERAIEDLNLTRIHAVGKQLKFQHINDAGEVNYATYQESAKRYAISAANSISKVDLADFDGNPLITRNPDGTLNYTDLFNEGLDLSNYNYMVANKIFKIRDIYDRLMADIRNYTTR